MPSNDDKLIKACQTGDMDELRAALAAGASVDCTTPDDVRSSCSALGSHARHGPSRGLRCLLARSTAKSRCTWRASTTRRR
jgi:hypothetical protein